MGEFRLAAICGLQIIVHPDHLEELIAHYERTGHPTELMQLLEQGLGLEGAHSGVFTELGVLYSKYLPEKLMEHLKLFHKRMNVPKMLRACEKALLWTETVYLYKEDGQPDNAVKTMIEHSVAFQHDLFLDCIQKARNQEVYYKAIHFYLEQHPLLLDRLLAILTPNLDHARVVHQLRRAENLPLVLPYLKSVQKENLTVVNEALNELYIDDEDYESLRESIDSYDNFDQIALAIKIEKHELLEFRRIAAYLYKKNKRWSQSVTLSKADKMYKDAIDTAAESGDADLVEDLLRFFVDVRVSSSLLLTPCPPACLALTGLGGWLALCVGVAGPRVLLCGAVHVLRAHPARRGARAGVAQRLLRLLHALHHPVPAPQPREDQGARDQGVEQGGGEGGGEQRRRGRGRRLDGPLRRAAAAHGRQPHDAGQRALQRRHGRVRPARL